jgi:hypothetical protein
MRLGVAQPLRGTWKGHQSIARVGGLRGHRIFYERQQRRGQKENPLETNVHLPVERLLGGFPEAGIQPENH